MDKLVSSFAFTIVVVLKMMVMAECRGLSIFDLPEFSMLTRITDAKDPVDFDVNTGDPPIMKFPFGGEKIIQVYKKFLTYCPGMLQFHGLEELLMAFSGVSFNVMTQFADEHQSIRHVFLHHAASFMNHSCEHNTEYSHKVADRLLRCIAIRPITKGEEITISYAYDANPIVRRQKLFVIYGFVCNCSFCKRMRFPTPESSVAAFDC
jgi:hypothetical protein